MYRPIRADHPECPGVHHALPPEAVAEEFIKGLSARVTLTPEETAAVRSILVDQVKKRQELFRSRVAEKSGAAGLLALRDGLRALQREADAKLAAVLPPVKMAAVRHYMADIYLHDNPPKYGYVGHGI